MPIEWSKSKFLVATRDGLSVRVQTLVFPTSIFVRPSLEHSCPFVSMIMPLGSFFLLWRFVFEVVGEGRCQSGVERVEGWMTLKHRSVINRFSLRDPGEGDR